MIQLIGYPPICWVFVLCVLLFFFGLWIISTLHWVGSPTGTAMPIYAPHVWCICLQLWYCDIVVYIYKCWEICIQCVPIHGAFGISKLLPNVFFSSMGLSSMLYLNSGAYLQEQPHFTWNLGNFNRESLASITIPKIWQFALVYSPSVGCYAWEDVWRCSTPR